MSVIPGDVDADRGPSTMVPLRHLLVGLCFLVLGILVGIGNGLAVLPGRALLAHLHLVLLGWVGVTILGAMTQFVPVWTGTRLYSATLANVQLALVAGGVLTFATAWLFLAWQLLALGALALLAGIIVFCYNIARTLAGVSDWDVTARHFAYALLAFALLATFGFLLALDYATGVLAVLGVPHAALRDAHVTVALFGAVLTTIYGAIYQLGTMFTQTELHGIDVWLRRAEEVGHPVGVLLLATGRLLGSPLLGQAGALGVLVGAVAVAIVIARKLDEMHVEATPLHVRYGLAMVALAAWAVTAAPTWLVDPTRARGLFGAPDVGGLLLVTAIGFVVAGTLYHVVPFLVWVERYSDDLGFEPVPMIDDLYDHRVARADVTLLGSGVALVMLPVATPVPEAVAGLGIVLVAAGTGLLVANLFLVVHRHASWTLDRVLLGGFSPRRTPSVDDQ